MRKPIGIVAALLALAGIVAVVWSQLPPGGATRIDMRLEIHPNPPTPERRPHAFEQVELYPDRPGWRQARNNFGAVEIKFSRRHFRHLVSQMQRHGYLSETGIQDAVPQGASRFLYRVTVQVHQGKAVRTSEEWGPIASVSRRGELSIDPTTVRPGYVLYQSALSHLEDVVPLADDRDAVLWERLVHAIARNFYASS